MQTDELVDKYVKIRDKIKAIEAKHKQELEPYKNALALLDTEFIKRMNQSGQNALPTDYGTAYKTTKTLSSIADPTIFFDFVETGKHWSLIQKRLNNAAITEFIEEYGSPPPGINVTQKIDVNVRRS